MGGTPPPQPKKSAKQFLTVSLTLFDLSIDLPIFFVRMQTLIEELLFEGNPSHGQSSSYSAIFKASNDSESSTPSLFTHSCLIRWKKHNFEYLTTVFRSFWKISIWGKISQKHTFVFGHRPNYPLPTPEHTIWATLSLSKENVKINLGRGWRTLILEKVS